MKRSTVKVYCGHFSMLDDGGKPTDYYKEYGIFRNTYGFVFFVPAKTKGRYWAIYFGRTKEDWNVRTTFRTGLLIEEEQRVMLKNAYNYYAWDTEKEITNDDKESLWEYIRENGDTYIPGFTRIQGISEIMQSTKL